MLLGQFLLITAPSGESVEPVLWTLAGLGRHPLCLMLKKMVVYQGMSQWCTKECHSGVPWNVTVACKMRLTIVYVFKIFHKAVKISL